MGHGGLPQHRDRVYVVGIKCSMIQKAFAWPDLASRSSSLDDLLSDDVGAEWHVNALNRTKKTNLEGLIAENLPGDVIAELGSTVPKRRAGASPCLTATRTGDGAYWSLRRQRALTMAELMKLQGFEETTMWPGWSSVLSRRQMGTMIGNAMSFTVMLRVVRNTLECIGFRTIEDPYA